MQRLSSLLALLLLAAQPALACSCRSVPVAERFHDYSVVFVGKVIAIAPDLRIKDRPFEDVTFLVQKSWKGLKSGQHVRFHTMVQCCMCGISIQEFASLSPSDQPAPPGMPTDYSKPLPAMFQTWLVFADGHEPYSLFLCSHSRPIDPKLGSDDLRWLEQHARRQ